MESTLTNAKGQNRELHSTVAMKLGKIMFRNVKAANVCNALQSNQIQRSRPESRAPLSQ